MNNFKEIIIKHKKAILEDLAELIAIDTTYDENTITESKPFGDGISQGFAKLEAFARRDGLIFKNDSGYACHIELGTGNDLYGALCHIDVVPFFPDHWNTNPLELTMRDGDIIARGIQDDKGPLLACYYALKLIKQLKLPIKNKFRLIIGGDEERKSLCIQHYNKNHAQPKLSFTPDGNFPIIISEKSIYHFSLEGKSLPSNILYFKGGVANNIIPDYCEAIIENANEKINKYFEDFLLKNALQGKKQIISENKIKLIIKGKAAHASEPNNGINAIMKMVEFLKDFTDDELIQYLFFYFLNDSHGKKLDFYRNHEFQGEVTSSITKITYEKAVFEYILDIRTPILVDEQLIIKKITKSLTYNFTNQVVLNIYKSSQGIFHDKESSTVKFFLDIYKNITNDIQAQPSATGGGTYARNIDNCMCFGPVFQNEPDKAHQINERMNLDNFFLALEIYINTIYQMLNI